MTLEVQGNKKRKFKGKATMEGENHSFSKKDPYKAYKPNKKMKSSFNHPNNAEESE